MKKLAVGFFMLTLTICGVYSQDQLQKAEKKVYKSEENNRLYVNKDLGIYLWLSTSPDPGSEKVRLVSDSSAKYSNPMYFDTEGYNTVRSPSIVDTITKKPMYPQQDIIFELYADGLPPVSKSNFHSTANKQISNKWFYGGDLHIEIHSGDAVSGIESISYSLNDKPFQQYKDQLSGFKEGDNVLKYYSTDKVGNKENIIEEIFFVDNAPPVSDFKVDGLSSEKFVSSKASIQLTAKDSLSGVKAIYYRINNGNSARYYNPIPVSNLLTGEGTISFYAEDNLGNKEKEQVIGGKGAFSENETGSTSENVSFEFYVDKDPPVVEISVDNDSFKGNYNFVSPRSKFVINAKDEKAGVEKILYSLNSKVLDIQYTEPFSLDGEGLKYLRTEALDYVGNVSPVQILPYFCDMNAPSINLVVGSPKYSSRDTLFVSDKTKFSITATDNQSGVNSINYAVSGNANIDYQEPFVIKNAGLQTVSYFSTDNVNNRSEVKKQEVLVDNAAPLIHYHFSVEAIGSKTVRDEVFTIYPANTMVYIATTDASSGGEKIEYRINEGNILIANPIKNMAPGNYLIVIEAYDVLGNKSLEKIKFAIE